MRVCTRYTPHNGRNSTQLATVVMTTTSTTTTSLQTLRILPYKNRNANKLLNEWINEERKKSTSVMSCMLKWTDKHNRYAGHTHTRSNQSIKYEKKWIAKKMLVQRALSKWVIISNSNSEAVWHDGMFFLNDQKEWKFLWIFSNYPKLTELPFILRPVVRMHLFSEMFFFNHFKRVAKMITFHWHKLLLLMLLLLFLFRSDHFCVNLNSISFHWTSFFSLSFGFEYALELLSPLLPLGSLIACSMFDTQYISLVALEQRQNNNNNKNLNLDYY